MQEELERALRKVLGERGHDGAPLKLTVAGRTDRGVHAWGQVASYAHEAVDPLRLNGLIGDDVAVLAAEPMPEELRRPPRRDQQNLLLPRARATHARRVRAQARVLVAARLDRDALDACAAVLRGRHDFTAFTPSETEHSCFNRDVRRAEWRTDGELLELWIEADMFLRHMNRVLVGTMLDVACGRRTSRSSNVCSRVVPAPRPADRARARPGAGERVLHITTRDRHGPGRGTHHQARVHG